MITSDIQSWDSVVEFSTMALFDDPDPANVANPFLHPLHAHPSALLQYQRFMLGKPALPTAIYNMAAGMAMELTGLLHPSDPFQGDTLPDRADVLFISHFLNKSQAADGSDLYFGNAPERLKQQGIVSVTALIDHSKAPRAAVGHAWKSGQASRILLAQNLGRRDEREFARRLASKARANTNGTSGHAGDASRQFAKHARANATSRGARVAMRIGWQVQELVRRLRPRAIVTTYEGHSWERLVYHAARHESPDIICIGYHHALLFPATSAMVRRLGNGYDPDHILTAGRRTTDWLRSQPSLRGVPVSTLGSVRAPSIATSPDAIASARTCLVIPEGTHAETLKLVDLAREAALVAPSITFRIRLHPVLTVESVLRREPALQSLPDNVVWSDASLDDDLNNSRWALYRGTTAVIAATIAGLKPFYFDDGGATIDPIEAMAGWRQQTDSAADLVALIEQDLAQDRAVRIAQHDTAVAFCRSCFSAFDPDVLQSILPTRVGS